MSINTTTTNKNIHWKIGLVFVCLNMIFQIKLLSQCNVTVNAGPDQIACTIPATFQLNGTVSNNMFPISWSPTTGLSNPTSLNTSATVSAPTTYVLTGKSINYSGDLIVNGNFSAGNTGFTTQYTYNANPTIPFNQLNEGQYAIGSAPAPMHINWQACGDHTSGNGNMMLVNGSTTANQNAWCQNVNVMPNTEYAFSVWVASVDPNGPCEIQFTVNGSPVGPGNVGLSTTCLWVNFFVLWNSGANTTATVCIQDINTQLPGNDFAIDDIVFAPTCTVTDEVTVTPIMLTATATSNNFLCAGETLNLSATGGNTYQWSGPNGYSANGANVSIGNITSQNQGTYTVTATGMGGCTAVASTDVTIFQNSNVSLSATTCNPAAAGIFTQHLTNQFGCDSTVVVTVTLKPSHTINLTATTCDTAAAGIFTQHLTNQFGCDSTVITTVTLKPSHTINLAATTCNPMAAGVFTQNLTNQFGCDSTVITTVTLDPSSIVNLTATTCDSTAVGVFTQNLTNQFGCDSTVTTTVTLLLNNLVNLSATTCDPSAVGVFTQILTDQSGCDSTVITTVTLNPSNTVNLSSTTCDPAAAGVFTQNLTNQLGCDSTVITTVTLNPSSIVNLSATTCDPASVGVFTQNLINQFGCDSTVITTVTLNPSSTVNLTATTCNPAATGVFTQILTNQFGCDSTVITTVTLGPNLPINLMATTCDPAAVGVFTQNLTDQLGCDSTVITTVTLNPSHTISLSATTCDPTAAGIFTQNLTNQFGCDSTVITTVTLNPSNLVNLTATTCDPAAAGVFTQNLMNQFGCDSTVITTVALLQSNLTSLTATTCDPAAVGVFTQNLTNQFGCDSTVVTTVMLSPPDLCGVSATLAGSVIPCGETSGTLTLSATLGLPPFGYAWSGPTSGNGIISSANMPAVIANLPAGTYTVTVTSAVGLTTTAQATIVQSVPPVVSASITSDYNGADISCAGISDGAASVQVSGGTPAFQFAWSNGATSANIDQLAAGNYAVTVTDANGCTATSGAMLAAPAPLQIMFAVNNLDCFVQNGGAIFTSMAGGTAPYIFSLNGGIPQASGDFSGLSDGSYEVAVQDANGCADAEILVVNAALPVSVELGDDLFIEFGDEAILKAIVNVPFDSLASVNWFSQTNFECPQCLTQQVSPLITSTYSVTIIGENGCSDADDLTVYVDRTKHVYIPNAFSPNGDGLNDVFMVFAKEGEVKNIRSFLVFSRWGETVAQLFDFLPNDAAFGWDGQHRGQLMDPAVFAWFAEVEFVDGTVELFKGGVTLVR